MGYVYRCSRCRTRNTFNRPVTQYIRPRRCRDCGYAKFYVDRERVTRKPCRCHGGLLGRTGSIPHRPGSAGCIHNPFGEAYRMKRDAGMDDDDLAFLGIGGEKAIPGHCPF